ncbi:putative inorganic phosphate cotransporter [Drosophila willistoni]|nr:putative inorganic phosphate cotransporter [Drosophila willistoni]
MRDAPIKGPLIGVRHLQIGLLFMCIFVSNFSNVNVAISLVAMTDAASANPNHNEFDWSETEKSYILSSFYWGNIMTQLLGGYFCRFFGVKMVLFVSILVYCILVLVTPVTVTWGSWQAFVVIRVLMGAFNGVLVPGVQQHLANWSPKEERTRLGAFTYTAFDFGSICAMFFSGLIATSPWGWPGIFYVAGSFNLSWCILWLAFGANNPGVSKCIGEKESAYILRSQPAKDSAKIPIPWRAIFSSIPFIALLITRCCGTWGVTILQTEIPSYLGYVLEMNIKQNALYSALPFLGMFILSYVYLVLADLILGRQCLTLSQLRKTINTVAFCTPALSLLGMSFIGVEHRTWAIILMTLGQSAKSGATIGSALNSIDLSPNHAGIITGILSTSNALVSLCAPLLAGVIITDVSNRSQWQIVFGITAFIYISGSLIYIKWGSTETQPWNDVDYLKTAEEMRPQPSRQMLSDVSQYVNTQDSFKK